MTGLSYKNLRERLSCNFTNLSYTRTTETRSAAGRLFSCFRDVRRTVTLGDGQTDAFASAATVTEVTVWVLLA